MNASLRQKAGRPLCAGLVLFALRLAQNLTGFDPDTGLSLPSVPGGALVVCLAAYAALELLLNRKLSSAKLVFSDVFARPAGEKLPLVMGSMLLVAGGALLAVGAALGAQGNTRFFTGVLAMAAGGGLVVLTRQFSAGAASVMPLLPGLFFSVFLVLAVYIPAADDPVLARNYIPILAAALAAYALSQLAGFLRSESSPRRFVVTADLATALCLASLADDVGLAVRAMFLGIALVLAVFLALRRDDLPDSLSKTTEEETA